MRNFLGKFRIHILILFTSILTSLAGNSAILRCDRALFTNEEFAQSLKFSNPFITHSPSEIMDLLINKAQIYLPLVFLENPSEKLKQQSLEELRYLLGMVITKVSKQRLDPESFRRYKQSLTTLEIALIKQIETSSQDDIAANADLLAANLKMLLVLKGNFMTQADRIRTGKALFKIWPYVYDTKTDVVIALRRIRYRPNETEKYDLIRRIKSEFEKSSIQQRHVEMFANLVSIVDHIPYSVLKRIRTRFDFNFKFGNRDILVHYPLFLWSLIQANPELALEYAKTPIRVLPKPTNSKMASNWSNQLLYASLYFRHVMKTEINWIEKITSEQNYGVDLEVKTSLEQLKIEKLLRQHFPDIIPEYQIPNTPFTADFYVPSSKLIIEIDGDIHFMIDENSNQSPKGKDLRREEILRAMNYKLIRFGPNEVKALIQ